MSMLRSIIRQYIAPLIAVILFLFALFIVSYRIFLPSDLAAPAPVDDVSLWENQQELNLENSAKLSQVYWQNQRV